MRRAVLRADVKKSYRREVTERRRARCSAPRFHTTRWPLPVRRGSYTGATILSGSRLLWNPQAVDELHSLQVGYDQPVLKRRDEPLDTCLHAGVKNIGCADDVGLHKAERMNVGVWNCNEGSEMKDMARAPNRLLYGVGICQITIHNLNLVSDF
jgi:hypothetical protein